MTTATKNIIHKLETLPKELVDEVEDFIDFLKVKHEKKTVYAKPTEKNKVEEPKSLYGAAKGLIVYIADDFNEPLDDFKEHLN